MKRAWKMSLGVTAAAVLGTVVLVAPGGAATHSLATGSAGCSRTTNIEAIIDDSGSMYTTDPNRLRVQGADLLINLLSPGTFLGGVEFGSGYESVPGADSLFPPEAVGPNAAAMKEALDQKIQADNGATDYNAAFALADQENPNAAARIFLTDGGHNEGEYNNGHLLHPVPTYVIGFSSGVSAPADQERLERIASETGGAFYPLSDSSQLQSVMNNIGAALTCQTPPQEFTDELARGKSKAHSVAIGAATKSIQIVLTWANPLDRFTISGLKLVAGKRTIAVAPRAQKPRKLKVRTKSSSTFMLLKVSRLHRGTLRFKVTAAKVAPGASKTILTTQVGHGGGGAARPRRQG
jgi:hypothetical protein